MHRCLYATGAAHFGCDNTCEWFCDVLLHTISFERLLGIKVGSQSAQSVSHVCRKFGKYIYWVTK